jgi:hypothetical protein
MPLVFVLLIAVVPAAVMIDGRRWSVGGVGLWMLSVALLVLWIVALDRNMTHADETGGPGSIWAGVGWLIGAGVTASACVAVTVRRRSSGPSSVKRG